MAPPLSWALLAKNVFFLNAIVFDQNMLIAPPWLAKFLVKKLFFINILLEFYKYIPLPQLPSEFAVVLIIFILLRVMCFEPWIVIEPYLKLKSFWIVMLDRKLWQENFRLKDDPNTALFYLKCVSFIVIFDYFRPIKPKFPLKIVKKNYRKINIKYFFFFTRVFCFFRINYF